MLKNVHIKLTRSSSTAGPFNIYDQFGNLIAEDVSRESLVNGIGFLVDSSVTLIRLVSTGACPMEKVVAIQTMTEAEFYMTETLTISTGCVWRHLTNPVIYNYYYGAIKPYIIEHVFAYEYYDQIIQNVKDFSRVYRYRPNTRSKPLTPDKIEIDDEWFNKAIVYSDQQCSGLLEMVMKPRHNLMSYMSYPQYNEDSKTITWTKSDSWYQINTFWNVVIDKTEQLFVPTCETMSLDKELNQENMDYSKRSFNKAPIRGKDVKVRYMLDNKYDLHIVSRLIYSPAQISYK